MDLAKYAFWLLGVGWLAACSNSDESSSDRLASFELSPVARFAAFGTENDFGHVLVASQAGQIVAIGANQSNIRCQSAGNSVMITPEVSVGGTCSQTANQVGGVYVYHVDGNHPTGFVLKPLMQTASAEFGADLSITENGQWLAVGVPKDSMKHVSDASQCVGIMSAAEAQTQCTQFASSGSDGYQVGAVYLFEYDVMTHSWAFKYYVKPTHALNAAFQDYQFGTTVSLIGDGSGLIVGVPTDKSRHMGAQAQETDLTNGGSDERGSLYAYALSPTQLTFQSYYQSPNAVGTHLGKILHAQSTRVLAVGDNSVFTQSVTTSSHVLDIASQLPSNTAISAIAVRDSLLVLGIDNMQSDCTGVTAAADNIDCFNHQGTVTGAGGLLIYRGTEDGSNNMAYALEATITLENPLPHAHFGRAVVASDNGQYLLVGADDNHGCMGSFATVAACEAAAQPEQVGSGAVYQYKKWGDHWSLDKLLKPDVVQANSDFGARNQLVQVSNRFYFGFSRPDICAGYSPSIADVCSSISGLPTAHFELRLH